VQQSDRQRRPTRRYPSQERSGIGLPASDADRAGFRVRHPDATHDDARRCAVTTPMKVSTIVRAAITSTVTITVTATGMVSYRPESSPVFPIPDPPTYISHAPDIAMFRNARP